MIQTHTNNNGRGIEYQQYVAPTSTTLSCELWDYQSRYRDEISAIHVHGYDGYQWENINYSISAQRARARVVVTQSNGTGTAVGTWAETSQDYVGEFDLTPSLSEFTIARDTWFGYLQVTLPMPDASHSSRWSMLRGYFTVN